MENNSTEKLKHLAFIQNIIARMNSNSFQIKAWSITIVSAILAVYAGTKNNCFILVGIFPTIIFWFLDSYYLQQEKKFVGLYNDVAGIPKKPKKIKPLAMRPDLYTKGPYSYWYVFRSKTIWTLYLPIIILLVGLFAYLTYFK